MSTHYRFLEPLDVLFLRGNKLFGDPGSYGEALIPPWPSVAAGALRSRMMADDQSLTAESLQNPENFTLSAFHLARRVNDSIEIMHPLPADLVASEKEGEPACISALQPQALADGLLSSGPLPLRPVLRQSERGKPAAGYWLNAEGWTRYLHGRLPEAANLVKTDDLWALDTRVGVGLDTATRRADDGKLFSMQAVAFKDQIGFLVTANADKIPESGVLRFGGDGRAVALSEAPSPPAPLPQAGEGRGKFKFVLMSPGIFKDGWRLPGLQDDNIWHGPDGCTARLVCAAVPRAETVSGWDLAARKPDGTPYPNGAPKPAQKAAPTGSVYWLDDFQGDPAALGKLAETGLWGLPGQNDDPQRKAEGFNHVAIGFWRN